MTPNPSTDGHDLVSLDPFVDRHKLGSSPPASGEPVLSVRDLVVHFPTDDGLVKAVDGVSFDVFENEVLGIVGESGSGKTVTALSILGLIAEPAGKITGGQIFYNGEDLVTMDRERRRQIRGDHVPEGLQEPPGRAVVRLSGAALEGPGKRHVDRHREERARARRGHAAAELLRP